MLYTRQKKKIGYGLLFAGVGLLIGAGIVSLVTPNSAAPIVVTATPTPAVAPIVVEEVSIVRHPATSASQFGIVDIVARLRNPNARAGIADYPVTFELLDEAGNTFTSRTETVYLLPGAPQYAVLVNVPLTRALAQVDIAVPEAPEFSWLPTTVSAPEFNTFLQDRATRPIGGREIMSQRGIIENTSAFDWETVEVKGVALTSAGEVVGIGETTVGALRIGEQREFTLQWPAQGAVERVIVLPSVNIYAEESILRMLGDPNLLR